TSLRKSDFPKLALLQVEPLTGRTHQIRVHLASIGHPVVGDPIYGAKKDSSLALRMTGIDWMFLHAESLEFTASNNKRLKISVEAPKEFAEFAKKL
ncbi:MAG: RNA pseudouridine synthase, partial [Patescibacteria group bacterium]